MKLLSAVTLPYTYNKVKNSFVGEGLVMKVLRFKTVVGIRDVPSPTYVHLIKP